MVSAGNISELGATFWVTTSSTSEGRGLSMLSQREKCSPGVVAAKTSVSGVFCQSFIVTASSASVEAGPYTLDDDQPTGHVTTGSVRGSCGLGQRTS